MRNIKTFLQNSRSYCGEIRCVCVCALVCVRVPAVRQRKAALTEVCKAPAPTAATDGLSEIQHGGNWHRTSDSCENRLNEIP